MMRQLCWAIPFLLLAGCGKSDERHARVEKAEQTDPIAKADAAQDLEAANAEVVRLKQQHVRLAASLENAEAETTKLRKQIEDLKLAASWGRNGFGSLTGRILFVGQSLQLPPLVRKGAENVRDASFCAAQDVPDESLIVGPGGGVANVFVYLPLSPPGYSGKRPLQEPVVFDRIKCCFVPHALSVRVGQTIRLLNSDAVTSNVHIYGQRNPIFNAAIRAKEREGYRHIYRKSERIPVLVRCDIHSWMRAWHLPLDHPFVAVTDRNGNFKIERLPVGEHKFRVWHEKAGILERNVVVQIAKNGEDNVELKYTADRFK